jgi:hypothetical protein
MQWKYNNKSFNEIKVHGVLNFVSCGILIFKRKNLLYPIHHTKIRSITDLEITFFFLKRICSLIFQILNRKIKFFGIGVGVYKLLKNYLKKSDLSYRPIHLPVVISVGSVLLLLLQPESYTVWRVWIWSEVLVLRCH